MNSQELLRFAKINTAVIIFLMMLLCNALSAQITLKSITKNYIIGKEVFFLKDSTASMTLQDVMKEDAKKYFIKNEQQVPNFGFAKAVYWARFDIVNQDTTQPALRWIVDIGFGNMAYVDLYVIDTLGKIIHKKGGDYLGSQGREINYHGYAFELPIRPVQAKRVYIRLQNYSGQALFPLGIWESNTFFNANQTLTLIWGLYLGILLVVLSYHIVLAVITQEKGFTKLTFYLLSYLGFEVSRGFGLGPRYLWQGHIFLTTYAAYLFSTFSLLFFLDFYVFVTRHNLSTQRFKYLIRLTQVGCLFLGIIGFSNFSVGQNQLMILQGLSVGMVVLTTAIWSLRHRNKEAWFYFFAILVIYMGTAVQSANRAGLFGMNPSLWVRYAINIGSLVEILLLSLGIAYTIKREQHQRKLSEKNMQEAQKTRQEAIETAELQGRKEQMQWVSNDLHDTIGNKLLTLRAALKTIKSSTDKLTQDQQLTHSISLTQEVYEQIRRMSFGYTPTLLDSEGVFGALRQVVGRYNHLQQQTFFYLSTDGNELYLSRKRKWEVYQICLELINNITKHAAASEGTLRLQVTPTQTIIVCIDNGLGMTVDYPNLHHPKLYDRVTHFGGNIALYSGREIGLKVEINLPH